MRRWIGILAVVIPLVFSEAADWKLVKVPAVKNVQELSDIGFLLFHRAGDYWIGGLPDGAVLPEGSKFLNAYKPDSGELYRVLLASPKELNKFRGKVSVLDSGENSV